MHAKRILSALLLICTALVSGSCAGMKGGLGGGIPGSGNVQSEARMPGAFDAITVGYPADVTIIQSEAQSVEIEAEDNLLAKLTTEVVSGRLTITNRESEWRTRVNPSEPVKITVSVKELREIDFSPPAGTLRVDDLRAGTLKLILSGGAQITLSGLQVDVLDCLLSGAGDIRVAGTAGELKLLLSGMGNFNAADLQSRMATVELSGMGDATVRVESELVATITGAGSINYYGQPHVEQNVKGAGSVKPAG